MGRIYLPVSLSAF